MDAEGFRPERWDEDMPLNRNPTDAKWGYLPFNGGPRICLGSKCYWTEISRTLVAELTRFISGFCPHRSGIHDCTPDATVSGH
jgi:cytochrome P450